MKIYASLLLLASPIAAFVAQPSFTGVSKTALNAETALEDRLSRTQKALENRLAALEKGKGNPSLVRQGEAGQIRRSIDESDTVLVQGGSLKTWSYASTAV
eukprot:CAMPEP_0116061520 /NCGR_PEP_ID=MMETSP0322-20121206/7138_1 /TAXON_ID=163516 /ORGANISM="Leptocylindrus danicus var. apora, Strain B651" /LENGTH=100 /DNA_ID=CAMNT_0003546503 /DNA_START=150 /DNA_END=449 /DNA_ORIENTATION=+